MGAARSRAGGDVLLGGHGHIAVHYHWATLPSMRRRGLLIRDKGYYQISPEARAQMEAEDAQR